MIIDLLAGAVRGGTSIMYAGLGETISERAGIINLGTEGSMLLGALGGYAVTAHTGNPWIGVLGGAAAGALLRPLLAVEAALAGRRLARGPRQRGGALPALESRPEP